ncbi:MAG: hypothetical protein M3P46_04460 [Actinomycetota bacterium]|nr:hypothetical protein [Actinomycetota bacterium]
MTEQPRVRLAAFAAALALVFGASYGLGALTGDLVLDAPRAQQVEHADAPHGEEPR